MKMKEYKDGLGNKQIRLHQIVNVKVRNTIHKGMIIKSIGLNYYIQCENGKIYTADRWKLEEVNEVIYE